MKMELSAIQKEAMFTAFLLTAVTLQVCCPSSLTFSDIRYATPLVYNFLTESDGLKIQQGNTVKYQFKDGGNFIVNTGSVGIGTTFLSPDAKLTVAGRIHAQEVKVELSAGTGPDFVFESTYNLRSLAEVKKFIRENKHLPDIEPAIVMEAHGVQLGDMSMKLLQKVEELTLYMIDLKEEINILKERNEKLEVELTKSKSNNSDITCINLPCNLLADLKSDLVC